MCSLYYIHYKCVIIILEQILQMWPSVLKTHCEILTATFQFSKISALADTKLISHCSLLQVRICLSFISSFQNTVLLSLATCFHKDKFL